MHKSIKQLVVVVNIVCYVYVICLTLYFYLNAFDAVAFWELYANFLIPLPLHYSKAHQTVQFKAGVGSLLRECFHLL